MSDTLTAPDLTQVQHRSYECRAEANTKAREVVGIGVPLGEEIEVFPGFRESFDPACEFDGIENAKIAYRHGEVIGKLKQHTREKTAINIVGGISKTRDGDDALTLAEDGAIDSLSIGFRPLEWRENDEGVITYTRVLVREFSLVPYPAYESARITQVREATNPRKENTPMSDTLTREQVDTLLDEREADLTENMKRELSTALAEFKPNQGAAPLGHQWRSAGEFIKAVAKGDDDALEFHRAYTGGTLADGDPQSVWVKDAIKLVEKPRKVINMFGKETLPPQGNVLEYYKLATNSVAVAEQEDEGDDLTYGEVTLTTATSDVKTYGGYVQHTRQAIERSTAPLMSTSFKAQTLAYANATEAAARSFLYALVAAQITATNNLDAAAVVASMENGDWLDLIVDGAETFEDRGFTIEGLAVSKDVFKSLYRLEDGAGHNLMNVYGTGVNVTGQINAKGLSGNIANVPVSLLPGAAAGTAFFYDPVAITTLESPGAPIQLQDENVINLSKVFSVYGYMSLQAQFPTAILPIDGLTV